MAAVDAGELARLERPREVIRGFLVAELAAGLIPGPLRVVHRLLRVAGSAPPR